MAGLDEVMERLLSDSAFVARLTADPVTALAGYTLSDDDREVLAATLSTDAGTSGAVEQRTTQSSVAGLLSAFEGVLGPSGATSTPGLDRMSAGANSDSDKAATFTSIAMAESRGDS